MKINSRIIVMITVSLILTSVIITLLAVTQIRRTGKMAIRRIETLSEDNTRQMRADGEQMAGKFREELLSRKKAYLKSQVQTAMSVLEEAYRDAHDPEKLKTVYRDKLQNTVNTAYGILEAMAREKTMFSDEQRAKAAGIVRTLRYGPENKDYFWINDVYPRMIMHPYKSELNGTDLTNYEDPNGKKLFVEFVKVCQENGEGFVDYYWPKYGAETPQPKLSYVKLFKPWNWIIGSGVYLEIAEEQLKADSADTIRAMKYGPENKDYFWINDIHPNMIMHPYKSELNGTDLTGYKDPNGKRLFVEFVEVCKENGEGFVDYYWPKYGAETPQPKLSYVKLFKPWNWIIGTGLYIDDIGTILKSRDQELNRQIDASVSETEKRIIAVKEEIHNKVNRTLIQIVITTLLVLCVAVLIASFLTRRKVIRPIYRIIRGLSDIAHQVTVASAEIASVSQVMAENASRQATSVEESSVFLKDMASMSRETSELTHGAEQLMAENIEKSGRSLKALMELTRNMSKIESDSDQISQIINIIDSIAAQTNLLALNAAVEAARAGEGGSGFAIVAEEVKSLALRTAEAARNTQVLLQDTLERLSDAARSIKNVSNDFTGIIESATTMGEKTAVITRASKKQSGEIDEVSHATYEINDASQRIAASAQESAAAARQLSGYAREMESFVLSLAAMVVGKKRSGK
ncbi:cache domain-containing protein [Desulfococcaceae bacterium HSG8]|nr:cache domain-containing protein [Desulfococcaceae bacterium HSG8]